MKDAEYEAQKQAVEELIDAWKPRLRLDGWILLSHHYQSSRAFEVERPNDAGAVACCEVRWPYMIANLHFNHEDLKDDEEGLESVVVHEMAHVLVAQMHYVATPFIPAYARAMWNDHHERVTTMVTNALLKTKEGVSGW